MISFVNKTATPTDSFVERKGVSFLGKTIQTVEKTPGKRISVKVVWKNKQLMCRKSKEVFEIANVNKLNGCKWIYALPTNTYFPVGYKKPYVPISDNDKDKYDMLLRFWGKYWLGMTIYGKVVDGVFYETKHKVNESNISKVTNETGSSSTVSRVV